MHKEMASMAPEITNIHHTFVDSSMFVLPKNCEEESYRSHILNDTSDLSRIFMTPLTPIDTMEHPPSTLSPPYTPSSTHSSPPSPHLVLSPKDFAPFRAFRRRENVDYSEIKRRPKKCSDVKRVVLPSLPKKRKNNHVKIQEGEWESKGESERKRVYINNSTGGQFRPCFEAVERKVDSLILREGDDVTAVTVDDEGEKIVGVARITRIYVAPKSRDLHAAVLWYYLPCQVEDANMNALPHEIFPSKHLDSLPLRSIENKVEVMKTSQYIQYMTAVARSSTFPFCRNENVQNDYNKKFFARYPYDCVKKRILYREKKGM